MAGSGRLPFFVSPLPSILASSLLLRRRLFQNPRPVELNVRIVLLEQTNRVFVDRGAANANARGRAEKIQETLLPPTAASASARQERGGLVAALVP